MRGVEEQYGNAAGSVDTLDFSNTGDATYRQTVVSLPFVRTESAREREMGWSLREESMIGRPSRREGHTSSFRRSLKQRPWQVGPYHHGMARQVAGLQHSGSCEYIE